jgi:hypothetical protein
VGRRAPARRVAGLEPRRRGGARRGGGAGLDYDAAGDRLVGWHGGAPYILDLSTRKWSRGSADGAPSAQQQTGTYGRWRYVPDRKVFILVTGADAVYFYRPPPDDDKAQPKR